MIGPPTEPLFEPRFGLQVDRTSGLAKLGRWRRIGPTHDDNTMSSEIVTGEEWHRLAEHEIFLVDRPTDAVIFNILGPARAENGDASAATAIDAAITSHLPLAELISTLAAQSTERHAAFTRVLDVRIWPPTFVVAIAGGIASGKTVTAKLLAAILCASGDVEVDVVSTDGFLFSNAELDHRNLTERKGFPESFDHDGLIRFLAAIKSGQRDVIAPVYDHARYDVVHDRHQTIDRCDILIIEGVNVLQAALIPAGPRIDGKGLLVSDFVDLSVYLDADEVDLHDWFVARLRQLRRETANDDASFFANFNSFSEADFAAMGEMVWQTINRPNLIEHIAPTRHRADLIVEKSADHTVRLVTLRRR